MPKISISEKEVLSFLNSWANGVIAIGKEFINENDHKNCARDFILKHYNFNSGNVLFKPTFTSEKIFRNNLSNNLKNNRRREKCWAVCTFGNQQNVFRFKR